MTGLLAGFGFKIGSESRGREFIFTSSVAQTVKIFVGDDEAIYNRLSGTVTVNGTVKTESQGINFSNSFRSVSALAANGVEVLITPALNVNGITIISASFADNSSTAPYSNGAIIAKSSAPVSLTDGDCILASDNQAVISGVTYNAGSLKNPVFIPAGKGLYFMANGAQSSGCHRSILYEIH